MNKAASKASSPDAYVDALGGWQRQQVTALRKAVRSVAGLEEEIKYGHLVYSSNGPVLMIRAEDERVLFGFWRGQRLQSLEERLEPGGKHEMATMTLREDTRISRTVIRKLATEAVALNAELGDPRAAARRKTAGRRGRSS